MSSLVVPKEKLFKFACIKPDPTRRNMFFVNSRLINQTNNGRHILHEACLFRDEYLVRKILEIRKTVDIDLDVITEHGDTPLLLCLKLDSSSDITKKRTIAKLLIEAGADINARDAESRNILSLSLVVDKELFDFLLERPDIDLDAPLDDETGETILIRLIRLRYFNLALKVLSKGTDVNFQTDPAGKTALMYLLEHGINPLSFMDHTDSETILAPLPEELEDIGKESLFRAILRRPELDLTLTDSSGRNALNYAVSGSIDRELIALLKKRTL